MSRVVRYRFASYGEVFEPAPETLVLDVGMKTVHGVIDHHHPDAEPECTASLIAKYPGLVLDHLGSGMPGVEPPPLTIVTHRLPDFDALASVFLSLKLLETGRIDTPLKTIAAYTKLVDSALLPKNLNLSGTPYAILRGLFSGSKKSEDQINRDRLEEGLKFMRFLYARAAEGRDIIENERLYDGIDRYDHARRKVQADYSNYLADMDRGQAVRLFLPTIDRTSQRDVDGLFVKNPRSFLLKEWAHRDTEHPTLRDGYSFVAMNFGNTRFILGVDPTKGINLRGLGALLNERERDKRRAQGIPGGQAWYEGNCPLFNFRIIDSPQDGTFLAPKELLDACLTFGSGHLIKT